MKIKSKITFFLFLLSASGLFSQGLYITLNSGYNFSAAKNLMIATENTSNYGNGTNTYTHKNIKGSGSFGRGFDFGTTVGHMFTKHYGAELNISYLGGSEIKSTETVTGANSSSSSSNIITGNMFRLTPSFRLQVGHEKSDVYMRGGLVIGANAKVTQTKKDESNSFGTIDTDEQQEVFTGGLSFGFSAGVGFIYKFTHLIGVFVEAGMFMQSWAPKKSQYVKYNHNGVDQLPVMSTFEKQTVYVNEYTNTYTSGTLPDNTVPDKSLKTYFPFSSAGINFGIRFHLGAKEVVEKPELEDKTHHHALN